MMRGSLSGMASIAFETIAGLGDMAIDAFEFDGGLALLTFGVTLLTGSGSESTSYLRLFSFGIIGRTAGSRHGGPA